MQKIYITCFGGIAFCGQLLRGKKQQGGSFPGSLLHDGGSTWIYFLSFHFLVIVPTVCYTSCKAHIAYGFGSVNALVFLDISENLHFHEKNLGENGKTDMCKGLAGRMEMG